MDTEVDALTSDGISQRRLDAARLGALLLAAGVLAGLLAWRVWGFTDPNNLLKLQVDMALVAIVAVGMTVTIARGGIDVSVGAILGVAAACSTLAAGGGVVSSVAAAVAVGALLGALNGTVSVLTRLHSALVTFGALITYTWVFRALRGGGDAMTVPHGVQALAQARALGLPSIVWIAMGVVVGRGILARRVPFILAFAVCGSAAGLAGVLYAGEYGRLGPMAGSGLALEALAAVVLGGAALGGKAASVAGTAAAAVFVGVMHNGMVMLDVGAVAQAGVFGAVVVAAAVGNRLPSVRACHK
ncbi:ABC transporter permease [bacterium]|nr:ABC transporter permease [bacterium]